MANQTMQGFGAWREAFTRGGEITLHELSMFSHKVGGLLAVGVISFAAVFMATAWLLTGRAWSLYWMYNAARIADLLPFAGNMRLFAIKGRAPAVFLQEFGAVYHQTFWFTSVLAFLLSVAVFGLVVYGIQRAFVAKGKSFTDVWLRGMAIWSKEQVTEKVIAENSAFEERLRKSAAESGSPAPKFETPYEFCGIPLPHGMAQRNFLVTGGMGSGKSVAIFDLCDQAAAKGRTMVIYDKVGSFCVHYYRADIDVIFNPMDSRSPGWNIFKEVTKTYGFDQLSEYLIPLDDAKSSEAGKYFVTAARSVFAEAMGKIWRKARAEKRMPTTEELVQFIFYTSIDAKYEFLADTSAAEFLHPDVKSRGDIVATLNQAVKVLRYVKSGDFSLKEFIREGGDRRLFLLSKEEVHDVVAPLLSMAATILYKEIMNGEEVPVDRYWMVFDELSSIKRLPILKEACTEARKYGAVTVLGAQNMAQLTAMYGKETATVILSNLQNTSILRVRDAETQELYSKAIGSGEYNERSEGLSWGASDNKDAGNINSARKERRAVMPSEIGLLPDNTGYVQLAGPYNVAKVSYTWRSRPKLAVKWIEADNLLLDEIEIAEPTSSGTATPPVPTVEEATEWDDPTTPEAAETSSTDAALAFLAAQVEQPAEATEAAPPMERKKRRPL